MNCNTTHYRANSSSVPGDPTLGGCADAVVVGHSLGGLTAGLVEARARVFLAAILPVEDGYARCLRPGFGGTVRDELGRSYWPDLETASSRLLPDCDRPTAEWAFAQLRRQAPLRPEPARFRARDVWIGCRDDVAVDPDAGLRFIGSAVELPAGHFPMLTHAALLAATLESVV